MGEVHHFSDVSASRRKAMAEMRQGLRDGSLTLLEVYARRDEWPDHTTVADLLPFLPRVGSSKLEKLGRAAVAENVNLLLPLRRASAMTIHWVMERLAGIPATAPRDDVVPEGTGGVVLYLTRSHRTLLNALCKRRNMTLEEAVAEAAELLISNVRELPPRLRSGDGRLDSLAAAIRRHREMVRSEHLPAEMFGRADDALYRRMAEILAMDPDSERKAA